MRIAQQRRSFLQTRLKQMMPEAIAGLIERWSVQPEIAVPAVLFRLTAPPALRLIPGREPGRNTDSIFAKN
jgi:hypothetical protein